MESGQAYHIEKVLRMWMDRGKVTMDTDATYVTNSW